MSEQANNKTMKHTRGPWRFSTEPQPNGCPIVGNSRGLMVAVLAHSINYDSQREEALANARLIAAAPELLEALEECEKALTQYIDASTAMNPVIKQSGHLHPVVKLRDHARAAIAKATGAQ